MRRSTVHGYGIVLVAALLVSSSALIAADGPDWHFNGTVIGAARNDGFKMMPNEIETWKVGDKAFEHSGTTGFMITIDMSSADLD